MDELSGGSCIRGGDNEVVVAGFFVRGDEWNEESEQQFIRKSRGLQRDAREYIRKGGILVTVVHIVVPIRHCWLRGWWLERTIFIGWKVSCAEILEI